MIPKPALRARGGTAVVRKSATGPVHHLLDIYDTHLHLATNRRAWATLRRRYPGLVEEAPDSMGWCRMATFHPKGGAASQLHLVLYINLAQHQDGLDELVNTCAHEATHAALSLQDHIGHDPRGSADEPTAYLAGWITGWIWRNLPDPEPATTED